MRREIFRAQQGDGMGEAVEAASSVVVHCERRFIARCIEARRGNVLSVVQNILEIQNHSSFWLQCPGMLRINCKTRAL